jgi:4-diphosphocytidyl-2-C-methyl-D-erythritol kinase
LLRNAIESRDVALLAGNLVNVLETVTTEKHDIINVIKDKLLSVGALGSIMSGSGPSVFGIFDRPETAKAAYDAVSGQGWDIFLTETI